MYCKGCPRAWLAQRQLPSRAAVTGGSRQQRARPVHCSWRAQAPYTGAPAAPDAVPPAAGQPGRPQAPGSAADQWAGSAGGQASSWEDEGPAWPTNADWGEAVNIGDWGEPARVAEAADNGDASSYAADANGSFYGSAAAAPSFHDFAGAAGGNSWPFAEASASQQQQQQAAAGGFGPPPLLLPSDITLIGRRDADSMLPLSPSADQARFYQPRTLSERVVQVVGAFGASVVLSKSAVLAGPALLFPIWGPWIRAGLRNMQLYLRQFRCVGLWRAEVLSVAIRTVPVAYRQAGVGGDTVTVTVGDPWRGGAATELTFPYQPGCEDIVEGEPAELLVLCQDDAFVSFKVVREVYLPQSGMWLSEYPFTNRDVFLDVSLAIERGRQQQQQQQQQPVAQAAAAPGVPPAPGSYSYDNSSSSGGNGFGAFEPSAAGFSADAAGGGAAGAFGSYSGWVPPGGGSSNGNGSTEPTYWQGVAQPSAAAAAAGFDPAASPFSSGINGFAGISSNGNGNGSSSGVSSSVLYDNGRSSDAMAAATGGAGGYEAAPATTSTSSSNGAADDAASAGGNSNAAASSGSSSSSSSSSSQVNTLFGSSSSSSANSFLSNPAGLVDELSGVAADVASAASGVATGVASGVAASVAAGIGWLGSTAAGSSSSSSGDGGSGSDTAVLPDVIIDSQGVWSPVGAGANNVYRSWQQQQQQGGQGWYGQPFYDVPAGFGAGGAGFGPAAGCYTPAAAAAATAAAGGAWFQQPGPAASSGFGAAGSGPLFGGSAAAGYSDGFAAGGFEGGSSSFGGGFGGGSSYYGSTTWQQQYGPPFDAAGFAGAPSFSGFAANVAQQQQQQPMYDGNPGSAANGSSWAAPAGNSGGSQQGAPAAAASEPHPAASQSQH